MAEGEWNRVRVQDINTGDVFSEWNVTSNSGMHKHKWKICWLWIRRHGLGMCFACTGLFCRNLNSQLESGDFTWESRSVVSHGSPGGGQTPGLHSNKEPMSSSWGSQWLLLSMGHTLRAGLHDGHWATANIPHYWYRPHPCRLLSPRPLMYFVPPTKITWVKSYLS